jgi:hypothetical protein
MFSMKRSGLKNKCYVLLFSLIIPTIIWDSINKSIWKWDQSWYGEVSISLYYNATHSFSNWLPSMLNAFGIKAPGIAWLAQFFVPIGYYIGFDRGLLLLIVITDLLILFFSYKINLLITCDNNIAFIGSLFIASTPLFVGLSHQFLVEPLQLLAVVLIIFVLSKKDKWSKYDQIIGLVITISFSMLIKISSPIYLLIPAILIIYNIINSPSENIKQYFLNKKSNIIIYLIGLIMLLSAAWWYVINGKNSFEFAQSSASGRISLLYGTRLPFINKLIFWIHSFLTGFFVYGILIVLGAVVLLGLFTFYNNKLYLTNANINYYITMSIVSIGAGLVAFAFQVNNDDRFLLPFLIYLSILLCCLLCYIKSALIRNVILSILLIQYCVINGYSLGVIKIKTRNFSNWVIPVSLDGSVKAKTKAIIKYTCTTRTQGRYNIVAVDYCWLNGNSLNYYCRQYQLETGFLCNYTFLGWAETDERKAWNRIIAIKPVYFIFPSHLVSDPGEIPFNAVSAKIIEKVKNSDLFEKDDRAKISQIQLYRTNY